MVLRSYGQKDPLIEYKKEAFNLFENLLDKIKIDLITIFNNLTIVEKEISQPKEIKKEIKPNDPNCLLLLKKDQKISRNEKCPFDWKEI